MTLYTIGFTQKSAAVFFGLLREHGVTLLLDIRLNNASQLAGFTKGKDLEFFLREICACRYIHALDLAPAPELFDAHRRGDLPWEDFAARYRELIAARGALAGFAERYTGERVCLLCSEPTAEHCHRGLLAAMLQEQRPETTIIHL